MCRDLIEVFKEGTKGIPVLCSDEDYLSKLVSGLAESIFVENLLKRITSCRSEFPYMIHMYATSLSKVDKYGLMLEGTINQIPSFGKIDEFLSELCSFVISNHFNNSEESIEDMIHTFANTSNNNLCLWLDFPTFMSHSVEMLNDIIPTLDNADIDDVSDVIDLSMGSICKCANSFKTSLKEIRADLLALLRENCFQVHAVKDGSTNFSGTINGYNEDLFKTLFWKYNVFSPLLDNVSMLFKLSPECNLDDSYVSFYTRSEECVKVVHLINIYQLGDASEFKEDYLSSTLKHLCCDSAIVVESDRNLYGYINGIPNVLCISNDSSLDEALKSIGKPKIRLNHDVNCSIEFSTDIPKNLIRPIVRNLRSIESMNKIGVNTTEDYMKVMKALMELTSGRTSDLPEPAMCSSFVSDFNKYCLDVFELSNWSLFDSVTEEALPEVKEACRKYIKANFKRLGAGSRALFTKASNDMELFDWDSIITVCKDDILTTDNLNKCSGIIRQLIASSIEFMVKDFVKVYYIRPL